MPAGKLDSLRHTASLRWLRNQQGFLHLVLTVHSCPPLTAMREQGVVVTAWQSVAHQTDIHLREVLQLQPRQARQELEQLPGGLCAVRAAGGGH